MEQRHENGRDAVVQFHRRIDGEIADANMEQGHENGRDAVIQFHRRIDGEIADANMEQGHENGRDAVIQFHRRIDGEIADANMEQGHENGRDAVVQFHRRIDGEIADANMEQGHENGRDAVIQFHRRIDGEIADANMEQGHENGRDAVVQFHRRIDGEIADANMEQGHENGRDAVIQFHRRIDGEIADANMEQGIEEDYDGDERQNMLASNSKQEDSRDSRPMISQDKNDEETLKFGCFNKFIIYLSIWNFFIGHIINISLADKYFKEGNWNHGVLTLATIILPSFFSCLVCLHRYYTDYRKEKDNVDNHSKKLPCCIWGLRLILTLLQVGPALKYYEFLMFGIKQAGNMSRTTYIKFDVDIKKLILFECFLKSVPQLMFQSYHFSKDVHAEGTLHVIRLVSITISALSIAKSLIASNRSLTSHGLSFCQNLCKAVRDSAFCISQILISIFIFSNFAASSKYQYCVFLSLGYRCVISILLIPKQSCRVFKVLEKIFLIYVMIFCTSTLEFPEWFPKSYRYFNPKYLTIYSLIEMLVIFNVSQISDYLTLYTTCVNVTIILIFLIGRTLSIENLEPDESLVYQTLWGGSNSSLNEAEISLNMAYITHNKDYGHHGQKKEDETSYKMCPEHDSSKHQSDSLGIEETFV